MLLDLYLQSREKFEKQKKGRHQFLNFVGVPRLLCPGPGISLGGPGYIIAPLAKKKKGNLHRKAQAMSGFTDLLGRASLHRIPFDLDLVDLLFEVIHLFHEMNSVVVSTRKFLIGQTVSVFYGVKF